jgi:hypothetical protein
MSNFIRCFLVCLVIVSCKALPETNYKKLLKNRAKSKTIYEILKSDNYISLPLNIEHTNSLRLTDSIILMRDSALSNYKMFKSHGVTGKKYKLTLYSLCDCFGFRKYIFNSLIAIIDTDGKPVEPKLIKKEVRMPDQYSSLPLHVDFEWEYSIPKSGDYWILVFSKYTNIQASDSQTKALIPWPTIKANIKGDFMITIQEI